jgi:TonB family protein
MDDLKRWREERAARRTDRRRHAVPAPSSPHGADDAGGHSQLSLFGATVPAPTARPAARTESIASSAQRFLRTRRTVSSAPPPMVSTDPPHEGVLRRRELLARASHRRRGSSTVPINWLPEPERISPVHPVWDIPRNRRLRAGLITSLVFHAVAIPLVLLGTKVDFGIFSRKEPAERMVAQIQLVSLPQPKGQRGLGLRPIQNTPPPKPPDKPPDNKVHPTPPKPKAPPTPTKPSNAKPAETVDTRQSTVKPVPDRPAKTAAKPVEFAKPSPTPAINNDVVPGPLLAAKGPVPGSELAIGGANGVDFPYNYYLEILRSKIAQAWKVPAGSVPPGKRAVAVVTFRIQRDGTISRHSLEEPSGRREFDEAATRAIIDVGKLPPLPAAFGGQFLTVNFQFAYQGQ